MKDFFSKFVVLLGICVIFSVVFACKHNGKNLDSGEDNYDYIQFEDDGYLDQAEIELKQKLGGLSNHYHY